MDSSASVDVSKREMTDAEAMEQLRRSLQDIAYLLFDTVGFFRFLRWRGVTEFKPWVRKAEIRARWRS